MTWQTIIGSLTWRTRGNLRQRIRNWHPREEVFCDSTEIFCRNAKKIRYLKNFIFSLFLFYSISLSKTLQKSERERESEELSEALSEEKGKKKKLPLMAVTEVHSMACAYSCPIQFRFQFSLIWFHFSPCNFRNFLLSPSLFLSSFFLFSFFWRFANSRLSSL